MSSTRIFFQIMCYNTQTNLFAHCPGPGIYQPCDPSPHFQVGTLGTLWVMWNCVQLIKPADKTEYLVCSCR